MTRIILFNPVKYNLSTAQFCLCILVFLHAISVSADVGLVAPEHGSKTLSESTEPPRLAPVNNLDWVKKEQMTPEQQTSVAKYCCGAYLEPERDYQDADKHPDESPLRVNALSTEAQSDSVALLEGDVNIAQGYRQLRSDSAIVDQKNRQITLNGNVRFREPNMLLTGNHALLDLDSEEVQIKNATYVLHQASIRGAAESLRRKSDGIITITDSSFTSCEPSVNTWKLQTSEISLDQTSGFATVKNARLDIGKVPVFYFPYVKFPITERRSSGLLFPSISRDQKNGLDFSQPIYLNLAPNYDATITPRYIQHRGTAIDITYRYLNQWSNTQVSAEFLDNDKGGNQTYSPDASTGLYPNQGEDRYIMSIQHQGYFAQSWSSFLDFNQLSDKNYLYDIGQLTDKENSPTHLRRMGSLSYQKDHWQFSVETQDYQSNTVGISDPYRIVSRLSLNGHYRFGHSFTFDIRNQHTEFQHDDPNLMTGGRSKLNYNIGLDKRWSWGYLKPKFGIRHLDYQLNTPSAQNQSSETDTNPSITVPVLSLDSGIIFEKHSELFSGFRQTLEPRLFYVKSKFRDQQSLPDFDTKEIAPAYSQLFNDNRFVGGDRISDDHRLTIGLSTSLINKKNGSEKFRASIAQAIYLDDRRVALPNNTEVQSDLERKKSDLAFDMIYNINDQWRLSNEVVYSNQNKYWANGSANLYYKNKDKLFNISYRYSRLEPELNNRLTTQPIEQLDMSFYIPVGNDFNWVGRWHHDYTNNRELELFSGFEYNNCCWRAGLVVRRWLDRQNKSQIPEQELAMRNGVFLQIQFKGIAGTGGRVASILKKGIYGYEPLEHF